MNPIEDLKIRLTRQFPQLSARVDPPSDPDGSWWLDLNLAGHSATAEWRPGRGFGILSSESDTYGEGPDEIYPDVLSTFKRLKTLLGRRKRTAPPTGTVLRTLRESRDMSQEELAAQLSVGQSAISKLERRADVHLSTLRHFVAAMGGVLELRAKFPDRIVKLLDFESLSGESPDEAKRDTKKSRPTRSDTLVSTLRETYGPGFAKGFRADTKLGTLLERTGAESLSDYIKKTERSGPPIATGRSRRG